MSHHIVEVKDLRYKYPDGAEALRGVSFRVAHGEALGIVGANGAGKSTLLLHLNGCLLPRAGTVVIGDCLVSKETLAEARRAVGMVFQNPDDQLFMPTVYEDVAFGPLNLGLPRDEVDARSREALETVDALHLKDRPPYRLSVGEKRRAAIAAVLSMAPDVLVMDEPTASLDPMSRRHLIQLLQAFKHTRIIASHDLDMILEVCERTIVIHEGQVNADGPTREILKDAALLERNHLEPPLQMQGCPVCGKTLSSR